ncbi:MAG: hypothetical protein WC546_04585 [Candidatus Omnitrophota bacterium]
MKPDKAVISLKTLLIADMQNDFCSGGNLAVAAPANLKLLAENGLRIV